MLTPRAAPGADGVAPGAVAHGVGASRVGARDLEGWQTGADGQGEDAEDIQDEEPDARETARVAAVPYGITCSLDNEALALLVGRIVRQDEAAMASFYDALCGRVYALALHITGQVGTAEEVLQDTFWQVWRQAPRFDAVRGSTIAWIMTMARSRALDARRASGRDALQSRRQDSEEPDDIADGSAADPLDLLDTVQRDSALHATLATLDPLRRQLIALAYYRGLTQDEIATHMGLPLGTVKSHLRRTLIALREALGPDFGRGRVEVRP